MTDPYGAQFWSRLYATGDTRFDKGRPAPPLVRMMDAGDVPRGAVLVPGAGRGHEALALAARGFEVVAVDVAPQACADIRTAAGARGASLDVRCEDVLTDTRAALAGRFDAVLEHTMFCAIDPARREEYVEAMQALLRPGGVLFGLFYVLGRPGGPPFDVTEPEIRGLFADAFVLERLRPAPDSFPERAGKELEFRFVRR